MLIGTIILFISFVRIGCLKPQPIIDGLVVTLVVYLVSLRSVQVTNWSCWGCVCGSMQLFYNLEMPNQSILKQRKRNVDTLEESSEQNKIFLKQEVKF